MLMVRKEHRQMLSFVVSNLFEIINQFIVIKNDKVLKIKLEQFYRRYNYDLFVGKTRFNYLFAMVMEYMDVKKIDQSMLMAGYLGENLIYEKGEKENG